MRVFPKGQAMPKRKPLVRVISSVSVVDQMVERFFFQEYLDEEGALYPNLPTKKGIGFSVEHAQLIGERVYAISSALKTYPVASDVSGWEKNFSLELAEAHGDHLEDTVRNPERCARSLRRAVDWWQYSLVSTPYVLDTGELLDFDDTNCQRSGDLFTTSSNGNGRVICAHGVGSKAISMGDDCLEWTKLSHEELKSAYADMRLPVRDVEIQDPGSFLFCSHRFQRRDDGSWLCWLETWERMLFEASYSRLNDLSTNLNYRAEVEMMPECEDKERIIQFLERREELLSAVAGHEKQEQETNNEEWEWCFPVFTSP